MNKKEIKKTDSKSSIEIEVTTTNGKASILIDKIITYNPTKDKEGCEIILGITSFLVTNKEGNMSQTTITESMIVKESYQEIKKLINK